MSAIPNISSILALLNGGGGASGSLLGGGISAIGSLLGGTSENRAARQARDLADREGLAGMARTGLQVFGSEYGDVPLASREYAIALQRGDQAGAAAALARLNRAVSSTGGSAISQLRDLAGTVSSRQTGNLTRFDQDTQGILGSNAQAASEAGAFGAGQERAIRQSAARRLTGLNRQSSRALAARGLNSSTIATSEQRGNAAAVGEAADRAVSDVRDRSIDRMLALRGDRTNLMAGRSADRMNLENLNLNRDISLREAPINLATGAVQSGVLNPNLGVNTSAFFPGRSGAGEAAASIGNTIVGESAIQRMLRLRQEQQQRAAG